MDEEYWILREGERRFSIGVRAVKESYGNAFCLRLAAKNFGASSYDSAVAQRSSALDVIQFLEWAATNTGRFSRDKVSRAVAGLETGRQLPEAFEWLDVIKLYLSHIEHLSAPLQRLKVSRIWRCLVRLGFLDEPMRNASGGASRRVGRRR